MSSSRCTSSGFTEAIYCLVDETVRCAVCNSLIADNTPFIDIDMEDAETTGENQLPLIYMAVICATLKDDPEPSEQGCERFLCCQCVWKAVTEKDTNGHPIHKEAQVPIVTTTDLLSENRRRKAELVGNLKLCDETDDNSLYVPDTKRFKKPISDRPCARIDCPNVTLVPNLQEAQKVAYLREPFMCNCRAFFCRPCGNILSLAATPLKGAALANLPHLPGGFRKDSEEREAKKRAREGSGTPDPTPAGDPREGPSIKKTRNEPKKDGDGGEGSSAGATGTE